jgi:hypothetical protein
LVCSETSLTCALAHFPARLFSNNAYHEGFVPNISRMSIMPVEGRSDVTSVIIFTEYNQPRYKHMGIIYRPGFKPQFQL